MSTELDEIKAQHAAELARIQNEHAEEVERLSAKADNFLNEKRDERSKRQKAERELDKRLSDDGKWEQLAAQRETRIQKLEADLQLVSDRSNKMSEFVTQSNDAIIEKLSDEGQGIANRLKASMSPEELQPVLLDMQAALRPPKAQRLGEGEPPPGGANKPDQNDPVMDSLDKEYGMAAVAAFGNIKEGEDAEGALKRVVGEYRDG